MAKEKLSKDAQIRKDFNNDVNKKCNTSFISFTAKSHTEYIDSGFPELNDMLGGRIDAGWPRGRMIELFGPEGSGKTWLMTKLFKVCQDQGLKAALYDAEGTYSHEFSALHGINPDFLSYSEEDAAELVLEQIEKLCEENIFDVIGIDSLAALVPKRVKDDEMGKNNISPLATCLSKCLPRVNSALKKSKTIVVLINQLRDTLDAYGPAESTPGGRAKKFLASIRIDVRKTPNTKAERPDLFDPDGRQIGHALKVKCVKNKIAPPGKIGYFDLMYQMHRPGIELVKSALESNVLARQRDEFGEVKGRKITFKDLTFTPKKKADYEEILGIIQENKLMCDLIVAMGKGSDFDLFIENEDVEQAEVDAYWETIKVTEPATETIDTVEETKSE